MGYFDGYYVRYFLDDSLVACRLSLIVSSILSEISEVNSKLTNRLQSQYIGRTKIEMHVANLQQEFIKHFRLNVTDYNLIASLPAEIQGDCINYIITSEIVFSMLSVRKDRKKLDFSPALIPLTKVLELLLNHVFQRMNVKAYPEMDDNTKRAYFDKKGKKKSIEFGPCILLLCDGQIKIRMYRDKTELYMDPEYIHFKVIWRMVCLLQLISITYCDEL